MNTALAVLNEGRAIIDGGENDFSLANLAGSDSAAIAVLHGVTEYLSGFPIDESVHTGAQPLA
jgi:hypothetical protein